MTPYNSRQGLFRGADADRQKLKDPGADGTVQVTPNDLSVLEIDTTGARTLEAATGLPVGTSVFVTVTAASVTVNGTSIADGEAAMFMVSRTASAVNEWIIVF